MTDALALVGLLIIRVLTVTADALLDAVLGPREHPVAWRDRPHAP